MVGSRNLNIIARVEKYHHSKNKPEEECGWLWMGAILSAKTFKVKKLWHNSFNNHAKLLTKDQNKGCVQRNHPENMLLKKKKSRDAFVNQNVNKQNTFLLKQQWEVFY